MENALTYKDYIGTVSYSNEDEIFYGKIHGINDLVTFEGTTVKKLKASFKESVDDYLTTCEDLGKQPEKTFKGSFNIRITSDLHRKASLIASQKSISLNDFIKKAVAFAINHENEIDCV